MASTVSFDFRPKIPPGEGQGDEGGWAKYEDCVFAAGALDGILLGYGDPFAPSQWRDEMTPGYGGPQNFSTALAFMRRHPEKFPNLPNAWIEDPGDIATRIDQVCGERQYPTTLGVHCNASAIINTTGPYGHAVVPVFGDGNTYGLWANGFYGGIGYFSRAQLQAVYAGGLTIFERAVIGAASTTQEEDMTVIVKGDQKPEVWRLEGGLKYYIGSETEVRTWLALAKQTSVTQMDQYTLDRVHTGSISGPPDRNVDGTVAPDRIEGKVDQVLARPAGAGGGGLSPDEHQLLQEARDAAVALRNA